MPSIRNLAKSEKVLILNPIVLDSVLADPNLRNAPSLSNPETAESTLRNNLTVESGGYESQMVISYDDTDSKAAALVCNAVSESYLRHRDLFDRKRVESLEKWLAPEIARWEQEVEERRNRIVQLSQQVLGYDPNNLLQTAGFEDRLTSARALSRRIDDISLEIKIFDAQLELDFDKVELKADSDSPERTLELDKPHGLSAKEIRRKRALLVAELGVLEESWSSETSKLMSEAVARTRTPSDVPSATPSYINGRGVPFSGSSIPTDRVT